MIKSIIRRVKTLKNDFQKHFKHLVRDMVTITTKTKTKEKNSEIRPYRRDEKSFFLIRMETNKL